MQDDIAAQREVKVDPIVEKKTPDGEQGRGGLDLLVLRGQVGQHTAGAVPELFIRTLGGVDCQTDGFIQLPFLPPQLDYLYQGMLYLA